MGIQMNQKELIKTFMMIRNRKKPFVSMVYITKCQCCKGSKEKNDYITGAWSGEDMR